VHLVLLLFVHYTGVDELERHIDCLPPGASTANVAADACSRGGRAHTHAPQRRNAPACVLCALDVICVVICYVTLVIVLIVESRVPTVIIRCRCRCAQPARARV
jgi:hypothetical protein